MFDVIDKNGVSFTTGRTLGEALFDAVENSAFTGHSLKVTHTHNRDIVIYEVEADTKIDPAEKRFPVIVHIRRPA